jgi:hypothetical protein
MRESTERIVKGALLAAFLNDEITDSEYESAYNDLFGEPGDDEHEECES